LERRASAPLTERWHTDQPCHPVGPEAPKSGVVGGLCSPGRKRYNGPLLFSIVANEFGDHLRGGFMNPGIRESTRRADAAIRGACVLVGAYVIAGSTLAPITRAEPPPSAVVSWGYNYDGQTNVPAPNTSYCSASVGNGVFRRAG